MNGRKRGKVLYFQMVNRSTIFTFFGAPKRQSRAALALVFAMLFCLGTPVRADETTNTAILRLINAGQFEDARTLSGTLNPSPADGAFLEGRILKVQGQLDEAIIMFRRCLALDPSNLAARRELAHTLLLNGEYDIAQFHFEALLDIDPDQAMHEGYRGFLRTIRQNKPFGASGSFALLPSSNINRGTTNTVFDTTSGTFVIDPDSKADSGIGIQLGLSGYARFSSTDQSNWLVSASLVGTGYDAEIHNTATAAASLTYGRGFENERWSIGPYTSFTWREDDADRTIYGLQAGLDLRLTPQTSFSFRANHEYRSYPNQSYNDGTFDKLSFSLAYQLDPTFVLRGTINAEQSRPDALHQQYDGYSIGASLSKVWNGGTATTLSLDAGQRAFVGNYPLTTAPRDDDFASVSFTVQNPRIDLNGFTPQLTCSYIANRSNVAFYDYDTRECRATLSTRF